MILLQVHSDVPNGQTWREWTTSRIEHLEKQTEHLGEVQKDIDSLKESVRGLRRDIRAAVGVFLVGTVSFGFYILEQLTDLL